MRHPQHHYHLHHHRRHHSRGFHPSLVPSALLVSLHLTTFRHWNFGGQNENCSEQ